MHHLFTWLVLLKSEGSKVLLGMYIQPRLMCVQDRKSISIDLQRVLLSNFVHRPIHVAVVVCKSSWQLLNLVNLELSSTSWTSSFFNELLIRKASIHPVGQSYLSSRITAQGPETADIKKRTDTFVLRKKYFCQCDKLHPRSYGIIQNIK